VEERVALLYEASERDLHLPTIQQLLALRHHLYDELLRIQDMLAADDPDLQVSLFDKITFKYVVETQMILILN
jgi:hypothetical protein